MANQIITRVQVEGNDVVSFLNGTNYVRSMSQILPQSPTYISYRYDSITISQVAGEAFSFTVYTVTEVGGNIFTPLTFQDPADIVQARTIEIYRLLVTSIFKGCCECGNTEPECSIQYTAGDSGAENPGIFVDGGSAVRFNYFTANNQDFTGFWPIIQDGSWVFIFSKTDPTVYGVYQLSSYSDGGTYAQFNSTLITGPAGFPAGTSLCVDVTSVGGSLVQGWQDTLDINSVLDKDNTVDGAGYNFVFDNNTSFVINSANGSVEVDTVGASLNAGTNQVLVTSGYIDVITPGHATAGTGWVLAKTAAGHVEYVEAGTGTISSIELIMPPAFTVSDPNPLTTDGTFTVTVEGTIDQYINGLGELADFPVYTVENGLHPFGGVPGETPADPYLFHLGGQLIEDTTITVTDGATEHFLGVSGLAGQDSQQPFGVSNLGNGGVASFLDYGSGNRPNPSVEVVGDVDLYQPLLELRMEGDLPNPDPVLTDRTGLLRLKYDGDPSLARMSIDYQFKNDDANPSLIYFIGGRLTTEVTNFTANAEESNFELQLFSAGSRGVRMVMEGKGQLELTNYATNIFWNGDTNIDNSLTYVLAVDGDGKVWKKQATGGGTVTSIDVNAGAGISVSPAGPITTSGTFTVTNEAPDQIVVLNAGDNITITGTYPEFTIEATGGPGETYAVNNGLEPQTTPTSNPNNFQLGGPLVRDTTITGATNAFDLNIYDLKFFDTTSSDGYQFTAGTGASQGYLNVAPAYFYAEAINATNYSNINFLPGSINSISSGTIVFSSLTSSQYSATTNMAISGDSVVIYTGTSSTTGTEIIAGNPAAEQSSIYVGRLAGTAFATIPTIKINTPNVDNGTAVVGQVLKLKSMTGSEAGRVEFEDAGGSGTTYNGNQGIYKDTSLDPDTFQLGAPSGSQGSIPFTIDRYIDVADKFLQMEGSSYILKLKEGTGVLTNKPSVISIASDADSYAGAFTATNKIAIFASTSGTDVAALEVYNSGGGTDSYAATFQADDGHGILVNSTTNNLFQIESASPTSIDNVISLYKTPTAAGSIGEGISLSFGPGADSGSNILLDAVVLNSIVSDATDSSASVDFRIDTYSAGVSLNNATFIADGQLKLHEYGQTPANFPDAAPVWALGVDSTGNVVEFDVPTGGGGIPFGIATGTDTYAVSAGTATTYTDGDAYLVRFTNGNTGASTLNVNSIGAANMYSNSDGLLIGGDIWAESQMLCVYDASLPGFKCIGTSTNSLFAYVTNAEATTITKGTAVYASGGTGDRMTVMKALATGDSTSAQTVGMVFADIASGQKGIILIQGELVGLDLFPTSGGAENWSDGEPVYLSSATAGAVTRVKQYAPNHLVYLGICVKASNGAAGRMYVRIQNGYELDELHNVQAQSPADKDTLWYDNSVTPKQWKTASIPTILGYTPANIDSPAFTGTPTAPTATAGTNNTQIATTAFVQSTISGGAAVPSYTMKANNTGASAVPADQVFRYPGNQVYDHVANPISAGALGNFGSGFYYYNWNRVGNMVHYTFQFYPNTGFAYTSGNFVTWDKPSDMPNPIIPSGFSGNQQWLIRNFMTVCAQLNSTTQVTFHGGLRIKAAATPTFEFLFTSTGTITARVFEYSGTYFTS